MVPKGSINLWCGYRDSGTAVIGPGSGKTTAIVVPLCCEAPASVWVTSNRPDVVAALLGPRSAIGQVSVFDPQGVADMPPNWYWNPLTYLAGDVYTTSEVKARQLAKQFAEAGRPLEARTTRSRPRRSGGTGKPHAGGLCRRVLDHAGAHLGR